MVGLSRIVAWLTVVMVSMLFTESRQPVLHRVGGGKYAWEPNVNFTKWASHETFYVGDWLYFGFDKHMYNVLQVNKTSYDKCIENNFIKNITKGGRDVFNLTELNSYYFICGGGYCFKGMKLAVHVEDSPPTPHTKPLVYFSNASSTIANGLCSFTLVLLLLASVGVLLLTNNCI